MKSLQQLFLIFIGYLLMLKTIECSKTRLLIYGWNKAEGNCSASEYIPGGVPSVQTTTAPTAKLQKTAFQYIFSHTRTGHVKGAGDTIKEVADTLTNLKNTVGKVAKKMIPTLGIVGAIFGTIIGDQTPTAEDILKSTNVALEKMTEELDHRIDEMKFYIDHEIIKLLKDINDRKYKFLYAYWSNCVKGPAKETGLCQREANRLIRASLEEFAMYSGKFNSTIGKFEPALTRTERKKLEVNLVLFRNYVFLSLMATNTAAETYKGKNAEYYELYKDMLKEDANYFQKYVTAAVQEIRYLNSAGFGVAELEKRLELKEKDQQFKKLTREFRRVCQAPLSPLISKSRKCRVEAIALIMSNEVKPKNSFWTTSYKQWPREYIKDVKIDYNDMEFIPGRSNFENPIVVDLYCKQLLLQKQTEYKARIGPEVTAYWKKEVEQVVECGQKLFGGDNVSASTTCFS